MPARSRILIVDDDPNELEVLTGMLRGLRYEVGGASSGSAALEEVSASPPALVLLSTRLPDMKCEELLGELKSVPGIEDAVFMLLSDSDESSTIASCLQAGAEDFISQPVSGTVFRMKLENQLELRRTRIETRRLNLQLKEEKRLIQEERDRLARYFSRDLIAAILSGDVSTKIGGEVRVATILFCDIHDSTSIAENFEPHEFMGCSETR